MALLSLQQIHKTFEKGTVNENHVLRGLDLDIEQGDFISVIDCAFFKGFMNLL